MQDYQYFCGEIINNAKIITEMKRIFLSLILTAATLPWATAALAQQDPSEAPATRPVNPVSAPQKLIFVPDSLKSYDFNKDDERWCWRHSAQTQNIVYFWEKPFGDNPQNPPSLEGKPMKFDLGNLQTQVERFYRFFRMAKTFDAPPTLERSGSEHRRAVTSLIPMVGI